MIYEHIREGIFIERPNRFIAFVEIDGEVHKCHVKNTGRCKELLYHGVTVYVEENFKPERKTRFSLIAVSKEGRLINMDSQAPNKVFHEYLKREILFQDIKQIRPEFTYKDSRFDFFVETEKEKILIEVKGVTLEEDNIVLFPDAPTKRGVKHLETLCDSLENGYQAYAVFVIQMENVTYFTPNRKMDDSFAIALENAFDKGVKVLAYDCHVETNELIVLNRVPVIVRI